MVSLQFEINAIEAEISALKTEVEKYEQAQTLINTALADLQQALSQVKAIAPSTLCKFKEAATALFDRDTEKTSTDDGCESEEDCDGWQDIATERSVGQPTKFVANFEDKVGYFHTPEGLLGTCYLAGNNKQKLEGWGHYLLRSKLASGFEIRSAKRLVNYKYELKIWGLKDLQFLYRINVNLLPPSPVVINPNFKGIAGIAS
jgi:hypothetical protein